MHPWFQNPIWFRENTIPVLAIEHRTLFSRLIAELCNQSDGGNGAFILSEEDAVLDSAACLDVVIDYFRLRPDKKRLQAKLMAQMKAAAQQDLQSETAKVLSYLQNYLEQLASLLEYPLTMEEEGDISAILKAYNPKLQFGGGTLGENLLDYMEAYRALGGVRCFVLVDLKAYLTEAELLSFYEGVHYRKLNVLLLESEQRREAGAMEKIRLIDKDFCELYLAEETGM